MVVDRASGSIAHRSFAELPSLLRPGDVLVVNDTRVFPARLIGTRLPGGGAAECFLVRPAADPDTWIALVHPGQRLREGSRMVFQAGAARCIGCVGCDAARGDHWAGIFTAGAPSGCGPRTARRSATRSTRSATCRCRRTSSAAMRSPIAIAIRRFTRASAVRLPRRPPDCTSRRRSCRRCAARGIERVSVTLHVGYGTFQPIRVDRVEEHEMEAEHYEVPASHGGGLTEGEARGSAHDRRRHDDDADARIAGALERRASSAPARGETALFITPGHEFKIVSGLDHQLSPAAVVTLDAGVGVWRPSNECSRPTGKRWSSAIGSIVTATRC